MFIQYFRSSPPTNVLGSKVVLAVVYVVCIAWLTVPADDRLHVD